MILIAILIIGMAGATSLALFSGETSSSGKITGTVARKGIPAVELIIPKVGTGGLITESHPVTEQLQATTSYRYTGANPDNYVSFNNELWRIIGVFDVDDGTGKIEQRIKLIRNESIGNIAWDSKEVNDWSNASGMTLLNSVDYWNKTGSYALIGLIQEAKGQIADAKWCSGGTDQWTTVNAAQFYSYERGTTVWNSTRPTSWVGKIGLMYVSDYGYATSGGSTTNRDTCLAKEMYNWRESYGTSDCYNNDWLNGSTAQWTIAPYYGKPSTAFLINGDGYEYQAYIYHTSAFRPVVYLISDIKISGGTGTESDPYTLSK